MSEKKQVKKKRRNRWMRHERYGSMQFPRDNKCEAPGLIRKLYSEAISYVQGALVRGFTPLTEKQRVLRRKELVKTRRKLEGFMAVAA